MEVAESKSPVANDASATSAPTARRSSRRGKKAATGTNEDDPLDDGHSVPRTAQVIAFSHLFLVRFSSKAMLPSENMLLITPVPT